MARYQNIREVSAENEVTGNNITIEHLAAV
jgi:hypothetical protein